MKKSRFIFLILLVLLMPIFSPYSQAQQKSFCYPSGGQADLISSGQEKFIPANFVYDGVKTPYWKFFVYKNDVKSYQKTQLLELLQK